MERSATPCALPYTQAANQGNDMRAVRCSEHGLPDTLSIETLPDLRPEAGEVIIDVKAASVNFPDVLTIQNKYQFKPPLPFTPGAEFAGTVREVGVGRTCFKPDMHVTRVHGARRFRQAGARTRVQLHSPAQRCRLFFGRRVHARLQHVVSRARRSQPNQGGRDAARARHGGRQSRSPKFWART